MTKHIGRLKKLSSQLNNPIQYFLRVGEEDIALNSYLGQSISLNFTSQIYCIQCGRKTHKSFQQGFCFPCLRRLQECNLCIIHPEKCLVESGQCPDNDWAHAQCNQPHVVYLANASSLKVGITRSTQVPTRWIDQGAIQAMPIFTTKNRLQAGALEVVLKQFVSDRTNWRLMLKAQTPLLDLADACDQLCLQAADEIKTTIARFEATAIERIETLVPVSLNYPVFTYPEKISTLSFDQTPSISGQLLGIKGQYLIMDQGVLNIRKFSGYEIECQLG